MDAKAVLVLWLIVKGFCIFTNGQGIALKIHAEFVDESIISQNQKRIKEAVSYVSQSITIKYRDIEETFRVPRDSRACGVTHSQGRNVGKCAALSAEYKGDYCGVVKVPEAHLDELNVYENDSPRCSNTSLPLGRGFNDGTNFIVYIVSKPDHQCSYSYATATSCRLSSTIIGGYPSGRPLAGTIELCMEELNKKPSSYLNRVIVHELVHLIGFNYRSIQEYVDCDGDTMQAAKSGLICWKRRDVLRVVRRSEIILQSPQLTEAALNLQDKVNEEIECSQLKGRLNSSQIKTNEDLVYSYDEYESDYDEYGDRNLTTPQNPYRGVTLAKTRTGIHWPAELFPNVSSIMIPGDLHSRSVIIDPLTIALLRTSGWYDIDEYSIRCINCYLNERLFYPECIFVNLKSKNVDYESYHEKEGSCHSTHDPQSLTGNESNFAMIDTNTTSESDIVDSKENSFLNKTNMKTPKANENTMNEQEVIDIGTQNLLDVRVLDTVENISAVIENEELESERDLRKKKRNKKKNRKKKRKEKKLNSQGHLPLMNSCTKVSGAVLLGTYLGLLSWTVARWSAM